MYNLKDLLEYLLSERNIIKTMENMVWYKEKSVLSYNLESINYMLNLNKGDHSVDTKRIDKVKDIMIPETNLKDLDNFLKLLVRWGKGLEHFNRYEFELCITNDKDKFNNFNVELELTDYKIDWNSLSKNKSNTGYIIPLDLFNNIKVESPYYKTLLSLLNSKAYCLPNMVLDSIAYVLNQEIGQNVLFLSIKDLN